MQVGNKARRGHRHDHFVRAAIEIADVHGATADGKKELVGMTVGYRESEQSWYELMIDLKKRGLKTPPKLAIGDRALGFWKALPKVFGKARRQRCTVHKTVNVLDKLPRAVQKKSKEPLA